MAESDSLLQAFLRRYRVVITATVVSIAVGLFLMAIGESLHAVSFLWSGVLWEGGKVVLVTSFIGLIFEFVMHDRFVHRVMSEVNRLDRSIDNLQTTVAITSGAIDSGLSAVYNDRQRAIEDLEKILLHARRGEEIRILGISLGDFLCPHGRLYGPTAAALTAGINVRALLLDVSSEAAKTRAQREESHEDTTPPFNSPAWELWYHETRCFDELKTASDVARTYYGQFDGTNKNIAGDVVGRFNGHTYTLTPLCFLAIHEKTMFLESYHYAGRGGEAPILRISKTTHGSEVNTRLFDIYVNHFEILWKHSTQLAPRSGESRPETNMTGTTRGDSP